MRAWQQLKLISYIERYLGDCPYVELFSFEDGEVLRIDNVVDYC